MRLTSATPAAMAPKRLPSRKTSVKFLFTLLLGAVGGYVFYVFHLPLPWMLGAMSLATFAALAGAPLASWPSFRNAMVAILGVMLGSQFNAATFARMADWYVGITGVAVSGGLMVVLCTLYYRKVGGYDRTSAYFSAIPGGLSEMMVLGEAMGGDARKISLSHGIRILTAVFLIAFYFRLFEGYVPNGLISGATATAGWWDSLVLVACAIVGWPGARLLRVPVELGADLIKVDYPGNREEFAEALASVPLPVLVAGGALSGDHRTILSNVADAVSAGAAGVAMGRNIFQRGGDGAFVHAIDAIMNEGGSLEEACRIAEGIPEGGADDV